MVRKMAGQSEGLNQKVKLDWTLALDKAPHTKIRMSHDRSCSWRPGCNSDFKDGTKVLGSPCCLKEVSIIVSGFNIRLSSGHLSNCLLTVTQALLSAPCTVLLHASWPHDSDRHPHTSC